MSRGYPSPAQKLDRERVLRGWSVGRLAELSGLSIATVSRALTPGHRLSPESLHALGATFSKHPASPEAKALFDDEIRLTAATGESFSG